jgi:hypothetical protein
MSTQNYGTRIGSVLVTVAQECLNGMSATLQSVSQDCKTNEYVVRIRLTASPTPDATVLQQKFVDSAYYRKVAKHLKTKFPLIGVQCNNNLLDDHIELHVTVPDKEAAWSVTRVRLKRSTAQSLLITARSACFIAIVGICLHEKVGAAMYHILEGLHPWTEYVKYVKYATSFAHNITEAFTTFRS